MTEVEKQILAEKLQVWRNTMFSLETDAKIANRLISAGVESGKQMMENVTAEMKRCQIAIETIMEIMDVQVLS